MIMKHRLVLGVTPFSSRGEVKHYCHFDQSETYEAYPKKDKSWITLNKQSIIDVEIIL
jgi:hypothetical protein